MKTGFEGFRVAVTGGASGIGWATSVVLREKGAEVVILDRNSSAIINEAAQRGISLVDVDVANEASVTSAMQSVVKLLGGLDGLVNCAGVTGKPVPFINSSLEDWNRVIAINLTGIYLVSRSAAPHLIASGRGSIVNISSGVALSPIPGIAGTAAYAASKGGVVSLSKALASEFGAVNVRVNTVCPGLVETPLVTNNPDTAHGKLSPDRYALARMAKPRELAETIAFVVGPIASYMTGSTIVVDGGRNYH